MRDKRAQISASVERVEARVKQLVGRVPSPGDLKDAILKALNLWWVFRVCVPVCALVSLRRLQEFCRCDCRAPGASCVL